MVGRDMASVLSQLLSAAPLPLGTRLSLVLPPGLGLYIQAVSSLGLLTQWSYRPLYRLGAEDRGIWCPRHTDRNDWQNENLNLGWCGQFYI